jgi:hypothetical protein
MLRRCLWERAHGVLKKIRSWQIILSDLAFGIGVRCQSLPVARKLSHEFVIWVFLDDVFIYIYVYDLIMYMHDTLINLSFFLFLQVWQDLGRVADSVGWTTWGQILSVETSATKRRKRYSSGIKCWETGKYSLRFWIKWWLTLYTSE